MLRPEAVHFADIAGGNEGLDLLLADEIHQVGELVLGQQGLHFHALVALVAARDLIEAAAADDLVDDVVADGFMIVRDDADALAPAQGGHEVVHDQAVDPGADEADDHQAERIYGEGGTADDHPGDGHRQTDVEVQVFVDDFREDVQPARGSVDAEHDSLRHAQDEHKTNQVEPKVAHHGSLARGEQLRVGADLLPQVHHGTENQGRITSLDAELLPDEEISQNQEDGVDDEHDGGHLDGDACVLEQSADDDGETGDAADDNLAGNQEIVHGSRGDEHADGHDQEFLPELPGPEGGQ